MIQPVTFLTFIIPTKGRSTLKKAIQSVIDQPDWNWKCIVMFDGIEPNISIDNPNVIIRSCEWKGTAGPVRNEALKLVDTDWIAFLDDDDWILPTYMQRLKHYAPNYDVVIFTYKDVSNGNIQPPKNTKDFRYCQVGISFAVRTAFIREHGIEFQAPGVEDFAFLDACRRAGAKYIVTNEIQYVVGRRNAWK